jgi:hypothetical protein
VSGVAHDFHNILPTVILPIVTSTLELLLRDPSSAPTNRQSLERPSARCSEGSG